MGWSHQLVFVDTIFIHFSAWIFRFQTWVVRLPSTSHHRDYYIFGIGDSYKPFWMPLLLIIFIFRGLHFHLYSYLWCACVLTNLLGPKTVMVHSFLGSEPRKAIRVMRFGQTGASTCVFTFLWDLSRFVSKTKRWSWKNPFRNSLACIHKYIKETVGNIYTYIYSWRALLYTIGSMRLVYLYLYILHIFSA